MKRKSFSKMLVYLLLVVCFFALISLVTSASAANDITVRVDGVVLKFDVPPEIKNGRTMVPFRLIFEALGAKVEYNGATSEVIAKRLWDGNPENAQKYKYVMPSYVKLKINSRTMETVIDNQIKTVTLDVAPYIKNGRTLVPVRAISESFGADVMWDEATRTVDIFSNNFFYDNDVSVGGYNNGDMYLTDTFMFYNGKLYFCFDANAISTSSFETKYIWDGSDVYLGQMISIDNWVMGIDKTNKRVVYSKDLDSIYVGDGYWDTVEYFVANFDGTDAQKIAIEKSFWEKEGKYGYASTAYEFELLSHPEWFCSYDENDDYFLLTEPGVYTDDVFLALGDEEYDNSKQYQKQTPANIKNNTLYYKSVLNDETLSISIPSTKLSENYAEIVLQTPRYIFVRTLSYDYVSVLVDYDFYTGLYALDRFENKLTRIMSLSTKGENISAEQFNNALSLGGGGGSSIPEVGNNGGGKTCLVCSGAGSKLCTVCHGSGMTTSYIGTAHKRTCISCSGKGSVRCVGCGGDGRVQE